MVITALVGFALTTQRTTTQLYVLWGMLKYVFSITPASCQRCYDKNVMAVIDNLPASCELSHFNGHNFCTDDCAGAICTFYRDKGYGKDCKAAIAELCTNTGVISPISCRSEKVHD